MNKNSFMEGEKTINERCSVGEVGFDTISAFD